ncbi:MAG TPA: AI-2E family transporter [Hanamia sp.]|nr:AI-2E family transporter [Hanamia sp.]
MADYELETNQRNELCFRKKVWIVVSIAALMFVFLFLFNILFRVLLLVLAGGLIALYFYGIAGILQRKLHCSSKAAIIFSIVINILFFATIIWFVGSRIQVQISELSQTLPATIQSVKEYIGSSAIGRNLLKEFNTTGDSTKTLDILNRFFSSSFGVLSDLYIILLLAIFFISAPSIYKEGMVKLLPDKAKEKGAKIILRINTLLKGWLKVQLIGMLFIGIATAIALMIIGIPMILTLAFIAAIFNFIPNFGMLLALIPAVLIGLTHGLGTAVIIVCVYTFIQFLQNAIQQPLVQTKMINIPPALSITSQIALGLLVGFWGILLATPVLIILIVLVEELYINKQ